MESLEGYSPYGHTEADVTEMTACKQACNFYHDSGAISSIGDTRLITEEPLDLRLSQSGVGYSVIQVNGRRSSG